MIAMKRCSVCTWLVIAAVAVFGIQCLTLAEYPPSWFDEIEILDMGRFSVFDRSGDWSVNILAAADGSRTTPAPYFHYLAGALLEGCYRLTGAFYLGRFLMLLSLPLCVLALFRWLRVRGFTTGVAATAAAFLLVDPNATICAHWYRPDLWCMTFVLTAIVSIAKGRSSCRSAWYFAGAGALCALSVSFWITSILFAPLVLAEILWPSNRAAALRPAFREIAFTAIGGILATAVLLIPLYPVLSDMLAQYATKSEFASAGAIGTSLGAKMCANAVPFAKIAMRSPCVWAAAALGVLCARRLWKDAVVFALLAALMLATRVYHLRMVYLMPWLFLFAAAAVERFAGRKIFIRFSCAGTLAFGIAVSVAGIAFAAWPEENTLALFREKLRAAVPETARKVWFVDAEHECYYAGRSIGWKMYSECPSQGVKRPLATDGAHGEWLADMDAVVVTLPLDDAQRAALGEAGFQHAADVKMPPAATGRVKERLAALVYAHGYPSAEVWLRAGPGF